MQLTRYTDYALRVLMYLAHEPDHLAKIGDISMSYGISKNHLMKVVLGLSRLGYVSTVRGKGGGLKLARPAASINLGEVVRQTEETLHLVECLERGYKGGCLLNPGCRLKSVIQEAQSQFFDYLGRYTIADMLRKPSPFAPLPLVRNAKRPVSRNTVKEPASQA
jgi:Rrf2 family transcriptional regulator, nitric oxide-sensitive transcriptional repressor